MGNNKKTPITIDGVEYAFDDLTQEQQTLVNHISDLDRKIHNAGFNMDQLRVGRKAFADMLMGTLKKETEE